eukprot:5462285-Pleurochrysis_carterae.AAC.1
MTTWTRSWQRAQQARQEGQGATERGWQGARAQGERQRDVGPHRLASHLQSGQEQGHQVPAYSRARRPGALDGRQEAPGCA